MNIISEILLNIIFRKYVSVSHGLYNLSNKEKSILCKGLNFSIPPDKLEYSNYLLPIELLYRDIKDLDLPNQLTF